jgi:glycosyltransferase involved in cell wall biosynthesis
MHDRLNDLRVCLASLAAQTLDKKEFEIIVVSNSRDIAVDILAKVECNLLKIRGYRTTFKATSQPHCYGSSEDGAKLATGDYLCFPSDDSYYVPCFAETMYDDAVRNGWELVYCDMVYDRRSGRGRYGEVEVKPATGYIDKTGFLLKREAFERVGGFPNKPTGAEACCCDGALIDLVAASISHGKVDETLLVHN